MKNKILYWIWGCLFILCALLGFIPEPDGFLKVLLIIAAAAFFVPGWALLYRACRTQDLGTLKMICSLCFISLGSTLLFLVLNLLSGKGSALAGELLYGFLIIFSSPMVCSQYWVASLFLWACLLMAGFSAIKKLKKSLSQG